MCSSWHDHRASKSSDVVSTLNAKATNEVSPNNNTASSQNDFTPQSVKNWTINYQILKAEILWCIQTTISHHSHKSNSYFSHIFRAMYPYSEIAKQFTCARDKTTYQYSCLGHFCLVYASLLGYLIKLKRPVLCNTGGPQM